MNSVTLYISTHNVTGLKYFGKTTRYFTIEELQKYYHGSGKYWNNHLNKHGNDVTMEIYDICSLDKTSNKYVEPIALKFSKENNIVESDNWANMILEDGLTGGMPKGSVLCRDLGGNFSIKSKDEFKKDFNLVGYHKDRRISEEHKKKIGIGVSGKNNGNYGREFSDEHRNKIGLSKIGNKYNEGKKRTEESKLKMSTSAQNRKYTEEGRTKRSKRFSGDGNNMYGKTHSEETRNKISNKLKGKQAHNKNQKDQIVKCPHCEKLGGNSVMKRWHFDNCKHKGEING